MLIVFTTVPDSEEAEGLAAGIVERRLAACVQVLPPMKSFYVWEGALQSEPEHLLLIKTADEKYAELEAFLKSAHSYSVPEIVGVRSAEVSPDYARWLGETLCRSDVS